MKTDPRFLKKCLWTNAILLALWQSPLAAAPVDPPLDGHNPIVEETVDPEAQKKLETSDITSPTREDSHKTAREKAPGIKTEYFYHYDRALAPHGGLLGPFNGDPQTYLAGLYYTLDSTTSWHNEVAVQMLGNSTGQALFFWRNVLLPTSHFRPFYGYGVGIKLIPGQQIATFVNVPNWLAHGSLGFEYSIGDPLSVRIDVGLQSNIKLEAAWRATLGLSWGI